MTKLLKAVAVLCFTSLVSVSPANVAAQPAKELRLAGVTVYEPTDILAYVAQLTAQRYGTARVGEVATTLELLYREDGYFLAEVFVAEDGQTIVVDEGEIGEISIEGVDERTFALIRSYMAPVAGRHGITQKEFERAVMLVEDIASISAVTEVDYPPGA